MGQFCGGEILDGAIFIADAHDNFYRQTPQNSGKIAQNPPHCQNAKMELAQLKTACSDSAKNVSGVAFLGFLEAILSGKIAMPPQLFLMGDMFDFLADTAFLRQFYARQIGLINEICAKTKVYYFEGNHDFSLKNIFKNAIIIPKNQQPALFLGRGKTAVELAHGDIFMSAWEEFWLGILRKKWFLAVSDLADRAANLAISKNILQKQAQKRLDFKIKDFDALISRRIGHFGAKIVVEGHYHQGVKTQICDKIYFNLPCFATELRYFVVEYRHETLNFNEVRSPNV